MLENLSQQVENDHFLLVECSEMRCRLEIEPHLDPAWGAYSLSPNPLAIEGEGRRLCDMSPGAHDP